MRKFTIVAAVVLMGSVAFASAIRVPFFLDNGGEASPAPGSGAAGFIGIINTTSSPVEITIEYSQADGTDRTPAINTASLGGNTAISWRPAANDPVVEGAGADIPNMTGFRDIDGDPDTFTAPLAGSATISWVGDPGVIQGRYVQFAQEGSAFSYLLPPSQ